MSFTENIIESIFERITIEKELSDESLLALGLLFQRPLAAALELLEELPNPEDINKKDTSLIKFQFSDTEKHINVIYVLTHRKKRYFQHSGWNFCSCPGFGFQVIGKKDSYYVSHISHKPKNHQRIFTHHTSNIPTSLNESAC